MFHLAAQRLELPDFPLHLLIQALLVFQLHSPPPLLATTLVLAAPLFAQYFLALYNLFFKTS
jgi:hypothetical protein